MKMRHLRYFIAVAEELSFTRAAQRLNTAQPSLSQQIRQLEDRVGVRLLERNQRSVRLTAAGEVLLKEARSILRQTQRALERARVAGGRTSSLIRLGVIPAAELGVLPRVMNEFRRKQQSAEIVISSRAPSRLLADLMSGDIDALFSRLKESEEQQLRNEGFETVTVERHGLLAVVPSQHPLSQMGPLEIGQLQDVEVIAIDAAEAPELHRFINSVLSKHDVTVNFVQSGENVLSTLNMVEMGLGIAILPDYIASLDRPNLKYRRLSDVTEELPLHFAVRSAAGDSLQCLYDTVVDLHDGNLANRTPASPS